MSELEQKLRDFLSAYLPEFEINEAVKLLDAAYELGIDRGREKESNYWQP